MSSYEAKKFRVVYRPCPMSDVTSTIEMLGTDAKDVKQKFEKKYSGEIVSIEEE